MVDEPGRAGRVARALHLPHRSGPPADLDPHAIEAALRDGHDPVVTLERAVALAAQVVPGGQDASVMLPGPVTAAATGPHARRLDGLQVTAAEGPTLDALSQARPQRTGDLTTETRWPEFAAAAARIGARSVLSCRIALGGAALGVLTLYADAPDAFTDADVPAAVAYAGQIAAALTSAAEQEQEQLLRRAVSADRIVGTAVGRLMGTRGLSEAEAYDVLRARSQESNRGLREVAAEVISDQ